MNLFLTEHQSPIHIKKLSSEPVNNPVNNNQHENYRAEQSIEIIPIELIELEIVETEDMSEVSTESNFYMDSGGMWNTWNSKNNYKHQSTPFSNDYKDNSTENQNYPPVSIYEDQQPPYEKNSFHISHSHDLTSNFNDTYQPSINRYNLHNPSVSYTDRSETSHNKNFDVWQLLSQNNKYHQHPSLSPPHDRNAYPPSPNNNLYYYRPSLESHYYKHQRDPPSLPQPHIKYYYYHSPQFQNKNVFEYPVPSSNEDNLQSNKVYDQDNKRNQLTSIEDESIEIDYLPSSREAAIDIRSIKASDIE
ncbi:unnamed protein product [Diatraea saccharalis]|uniref:Uncharacterized protein n=1 Tax=Diatraea saccharalis TaxID=40085 RepID=A0A9N9R9L4_9NEOP|nr:unnamed protein product [Diatraea saccharalis]